MNRNFHTRLGAIETRQGARQRIVPVYDQTEAAEVRALDPTAMIIITGVPRPARDWRKQLEPIAEDPQGPAWRQKEPAPLVAMR